MGSFDGLVDLLRAIEPQRLRPTITILLINDAEADWVTYTRYLQSGPNHQYSILSVDPLQAGMVLWRSQWLDYTCEEMIGKPFIQFLTEASRQTFFKNYERFCQRGWAEDLKFEMVRKDGSILPILLNATAVTDAEGVVA